MVAAMRDGRWKSTGEWTDSTGEFATRPEEVKTVWRGKRLAGGNPAGMMAHNAGGSLVI